LHDDLLDFSGNFDGFYEPLTLPLHLVARSFIEFDLWCELFESVKDKLLCHPHVELQPIPDVGFRFVFYGKKGPKHMLSAHHIVAHFGGCLFAKIEYFLGIFGKLSYHLLINLSWVAIHSSLYLNLVFIID